MSKVELYEGCYGLTRGGEVVGPFERNTLGAFPFLVMNSEREKRTYLGNGRFYCVGPKSEYDIIAVADSASELMARSLTLSGKVETPHYEITTRANVNPGEPLFEVKHVDPKPSDLKPLLVTDEQRDRLLRLIEDEKPVPTGDLQVSLYEGCYGLTRGGEVVGPLKRRGSAIYPFQIFVRGWSRAFAKNGRTLLADDAKSKFDIIAVFPSKEAAESSRRAAPENESAAEIRDSENAEGGQSDSAPRLDPAPRLDLKTGQWVKLHNGYILGPITVQSAYAVSVRGVGCSSKSLTPIEVLTIHREEIAAVVEQPA